MTVTAAELAVKMAWTAGQQHTSTATQDTTIPNYHKSAMSSEKRSLGWYAFIAERFWKQKRKIYDIHWKDEANEKRGCTNRIKITLINKKKMQMSKLDDVMIWKFISDLELLCLEWNTDTIWLYGITYILIWLTNRNNDWVLAAKGCGLESWGSEAQQLAVWGMGYNQELWKEEQTNYSKH